MTRWICGFGLLAAALGTEATGLLEVYELALANDPTFLGAGANNRAAQEIRPQARASLLPQVDLSLSTTATELEIRQANAVTATGGGGRPGFSSKEFSLTLAQPVYRMDLWIALDQAESQIRQADALYAASRQDLMLNVSERYFDILRARDELSFARAELEAFDQQLKQSQQRFDVGLIAITDVEEAKAGFDLARAQLINAENSLDTAREALREVTGTYHPSLATLGTISLVTPAPNDIDSWTETALAQNIRLQAARHSAETARGEIKRIQAGHLPSVDLLGSHVRSDADGGISGGNNTWNTSVSLRMNLPVYAGGAIVSRTRESRHLYQRALDELELQRRSAQRATREAFLGVKSGISRVGALEQAVRSNEAATAAIEAGFQVGTRTSVDVLDAQRDLFGARRDLAQARYDYILDVLRLKASAGTLAEEDLAQINAWLNLN